MWRIFFFSLLSITGFFYWESSVTAHPIDIHIPTSYDYLFEWEYERGKANQEAENVVDNPESSQEEIDKALDQLYGPNGNHA